MIWLIERFRSRNDTEARALFFFAIVVGNRQLWSQRFAKGTIQGRGDGQVCYRARASLKRAKPRACLMTVLGGSE